MKLVRRDDQSSTPLALDNHGGTYWKDTVLGKYIIKELADHFTKGNNVPKDGIRFTAVAKDGMLYFNDNAEELKEVLPLIDRWIDQDTLNFLIDQSEEP